MTIELAETLVRQGKENFLRYFLFLIFCCNFAPDYFPKAELKIRYRDIKPDSCE